MLIKKKAIELYKIVAKEENSDAEESKALHEPARAKLS